MPASGERRWEAIGYGGTLLLTSAAFIVMTDRWSRVNEISTTLLVYLFQVPLMAIECGVFGWLVVSGGKRRALVVQASLAAVIVAWAVFYLAGGRLR